MEEKELQQNNTSNNQEGKKLKTWEEAVAELNDMLIKQKINELNEKMGLNTDNK